MGLRVVEKDVHMTGRGAGRETTHAAAALTESATGAEVVPKASSVSIAGLSAEQVQRL